MKVAALVSILPASFALSWPFRQQPFGETPSDQLRTYEDSRIYNLSDTSSFLFNSLVGLLQQFPNSVHPNGHTICPGVIRAYTPLYHATSVAIGNYSSPPSPEWLAFDAEMSYGIMAPTGVYGDVTLWSYVSYRDLRVLYFDGSSAALGDIGVSDAQEVFIARRGGVVGGHGWFDDYTRLKSLCAWAKGKGIDGFVRMNTGFELMKCDFEAGLNLVSRLNITPPDTMKIPLPRPPRRDVTLLDMADDTLTMPASHTTVAPGAKPPPGPPGRHPEGWRSAPLMATSRFEWARVAVHRAFNPQPSIELLTSGLVTFYDPNLASLTPLRQNTPMYQHRVWNISSQDAERVMERVEAIVRKGDVWSHRGIQWNAVAQRVVDAWGDRLAQINETLREPTVKPSEVVERVRLISYTLLNPYLDTTQLPYGNQSDPELWLSETVSRCSDAYTGFILPTTLTQEEQILKASINSVVGRLCRYAGKALAATLGKEGDDQLVTLIRRDTERLLRWLDWPIWLRCEEDCGPHGICTVPLWPIIRYTPEKPQPRCIAFNEWKT